MLSKRKFLRGLVFLFCLWAAGFAWFAVSALVMTPQSPAETTDAIVVLTGGDKRIETGLALFAAGKARHLFISGVHPDVTKTDIESMWKGQTSLPPCCITLGHQATTTAGNAAETRAWMDEQQYTSLRLITANYHMARALMELRTALPGITIIPNPIAQPDVGITSFHFWELLFTEYHKVLFRRLTLFAPLFASEAMK